MLSEVDFLSKSGIISLIRFKNVRLCKEYLLQSNKKCVSFSTLFDLHNGHSLFSLGIWSVQVQS